MFLEPIPTGTFNLGNTEKKEKQCSSSTKMFGMTMFLIQKGVKTTANEKCFAKDLTSIFQPV